MSLNQVPIGLDAPEDLYAIIEIPAHAAPVKYEISKAFETVFVDRFVQTTMVYPCNYGYLNQTLGLDGDPLDILIPTPYPVMTGSVLRCRPIGILHMQDEGGLDSKLLAVPHRKLTIQYEHIQDIDDFPDVLKAQIQHFFEQYKALEPGKWVKVQQFEGKEAACREILEGMTRFQSQALDHSNL